jgi:hypothetical protein
MEKTWYIETQYSSFDVHATLHHNKFLYNRPTDALISQIYFCQETLHVSGSFSAHHQEFQAGSGFHPDPA